MLFLEVSMVCYLSQYIDMKIRIKCQRNNAKKCPKFQSNKFQKMPKMPEQKIPKYK